jgi:hypothetical protein
MLYQIIYTSQATEYFELKKLEGFLTKIRANNASLNVTGMLVYHSG